MSERTIELNFRDPQRWGVARRELRCDIVFGVAQEKRLSEIRSGSLFLYKSGLYRKTAGVGHAEYIGGPNFAGTWPIPIEFRKEVHVLEFLYTRKELSKL